MEKGGLDGYFGAVFLELNMTDSGLSSYQILIIVISVSNFVGKSNTEELSLY